MCCNDVFCCVAPWCVVVMCAVHHVVVCGCVGVAIPPGVALQRGVCARFPVSEFVLGRVVCVCVAFGEVLRQDLGRLINLVPWSSLRAGILKAEISNDEFDMSWVVPVNGASGVSRMILLSARASPSLCSLHLPLPSRVCISIRLRVSVCIKASRRP